MKKEDSLDLSAFADIDKPRQLIYKKDLLPIHNLKTVFREIRDYFAGNVTGISRDETIARNIMRLLFCKIFDEKQTHEDELVGFANRPNEDLKEFRLRISRLFDQVKETYPDIFEADEIIEIKPSDLSYIVSKIESYALLGADRDVIGDAFEALIGTTFRGGEGQFFTPRNVVQMMIDVLQPQSHEKILDPACGTGGFLAYILRELLKKEECQTESLANTTDYFITGIEKDLFLSKMANIYLTLLGEKDVPIFCENSLESPEKWDKKTQDQVSLNSFDLILTNPPFGAKIPVKGKELLTQYELGHYWSKEQYQWILNKKMRSRQPPQILFIERVIQFLKPGGRAGIVLPEGIFGNPTDRYIWEYVRKYASVIGVVSLSHETFQPSTHTKTSVVFLEKRIQSRTGVFMAIADAVGHNKNGKEIYKTNPDGSVMADSRGNRLSDDDIPVITGNFRKFLNQEPKAGSRLGFTVPADEIRDNIFIPENYNPELRQKLNRIRESKQYRLVKIADLVDQGVIEIRRGNEIGSHHYGTGTIPFVRTTDIVNWEIRMDPVKAVSEAVYHQYKKQQDVRADDILFVNDGTFLIGRSALVTRSDEKCVIQSHLRKLRVLKPDVISPYYLFYLLNIRIVQHQIAVQTFVQATLSTLGNRILELLLPIHTGPGEAEKISDEIKFIIETKTILKEKSIRLIAERL